MNLNMTLEQFTEKRNRQAEEEIKAEQERIEKDVKENDSGGRIGLLLGIIGLPFLWNIFVGVVWCIFIIGGIVELIKKYGRTAILILVGVILLDAAQVMLRNALHKKSDMAAKAKVEEEKARSEQKIRDIRAQADRDIEAFKAAKEEKKRKLSDDIQLRAEKYVARFDSEADGNIKWHDMADWLKEYFSWSVEEADRQSMVRVVEAPFQFNVFSDKLSCHYGIYYFSERDSARIEGLVQQQTVARTLALILRQEMMRKYPVDQSGTAVTVDYSIDEDSSEYLADPNEQRGNESIAVLMTYKAKNGFCTDMD